jgi:predicted transcriptional regulator
MENQRFTVSVLLDPNLQGDLDNAAFELRQSQTNVATAALRFYLDHLRKTRQIKPANKPLPTSR